MLLIAWVPRIKQQFVFNWLSSIAWLYIYIYIYIYIDLYVEQPTCDDADRFATIELCVYLAAFFPANSSTIDHVHRVRHRRPMIARLPPLSPISRTETSRWQQQQLSSRHSTSDSQATSDKIDCGVRGWRSHACDSAITHLERCSRIGSGSSIAHRGDGRHWPWEHCWPQTVYRPCSAPRSQSILHRDRRLRLATPSSSRGN